MFSRLTLAAATFAILGTATLTFATEPPLPSKARWQPHAVAKTQQAAPVIVLPKVEVIGKRAR